VLSRRIAELRVQGETREIVFGGVFFTGVPRSAAFRSKAATLSPVNGGSDFLEHRKVAAKIAADDGPKFSAPDEPEELPTEISPARAIQTTVRSPKNDLDPGEIALGFYRILSTGGARTVRVEDEHGRILASERLRPGEDAEVIAKRILRQKSGRIGFNAEIYIKPRGIV
jgi:hypothetical protein